MAMSGINDQLQSLRSEYDPNPIHDLGCAARARPHRSTTPKNMCIRCSGLYVRLE